MIETQQSFISDQREPGLSEHDILTDPPHDVLTEGWLHKLMLVFHAPARWPAWAMTVLGVIFVLLAALPWKYFWGAPVAWAATGIQALFLADDAAVLISLPRKRVSYGPWQAQFAVLAVPRTLATASASLISWQFGWEWGMAIALLLQLIGSAAFFWGAVIEPFRLGLSELYLFADQLPPGTEPIRVLHISDLHVERLTQREEAVLRLVDEVQPDIILLTGDYVNLSYNQDPVTHAQVRQMLSQLSAPYGVYATLGSPPVDLREAIVPLFTGLPVRLLRHDWTRVDLDHGRSLILLGLDCTHHLPTDRARLAALTAVAPNSAPQILLYHSPELMPEAIEHGLSLYLCGHTHGGQVRLPLIGPILTSSQLGRKYVMGLYRHGRTRLYVSRGVGLEGLSAPRVRFMAPPEITLITLMPIQGGGDLGIRGFFHKSP